jgi:hypothetical protein
MKTSRVLPLWVALFLVLIPIGGAAQSAPWPDDWVNHMAGT